MRNLATQTEPIPLTQPQPQPQPSRAVPVNTSLETLTRLDSEQLAGLFSNARWEGPARIEGHPAGRMLAVPGYDNGLIGKLLAAFAGSPLNVWKGKSFQALSREHGIGINRLRAGFRLTAFQFKTYETRALDDGERVLAVDYDVPQAPRYTRGVVDELRPVGPGLLLGRGLKRSPGRSPKLLVWFALDMNYPDPPVSW